MIPCLKFQWSTLSLYQSIVQTDITINWPTSKLTSHLNSSQLSTFSLRLFLIAIGGTVTLHAYSDLWDHSQGAFLVAWFFYPVVRLHKETVGVSNVRNFDIGFHINIIRQPLSLLLAPPRRLDADPSITDNNDKKIELSDENLIEAATRRSLSSLNTCSVSPAEYVFSEK